MKKKALSALLIAAMTASMVAGCGSTDSGSGKNDSKGTEAGGSGSSAETTDVALKVMGPSEDLDDKSGAWLKTMCEEFNTAHPEWNITYEYVTCSESDAKDTILQDPAAAADVYMFANDQISALVQAKAIAKLGGTTADYVKSSNSEAIANSVVWNGEVYGVPYTPNTWFMYYDKRVFSEDDVKSMETMLEKGKVAFPLDNGWYTPAFYTANGCTFFGTGTDEAAGIDLGGDKAVAVTKYICNLINNKNFVPDNNDGSLGLAGLGNKTVNAYFNGNWNYDAVVEKLGKKNVGIAALPTINIDGQDCQMKAFMGSKAIGVNPHCKNQPAAVALAAYLGSEEAQLKHFELRGQAPCNTTVAESEAVAKDPMALAIATVGASQSICQPLLDMQAFWDAATPFGAAFLKGAEDQITVDNAAEKTEAFNKQINGSVIE